MEAQGFYKTGEISNVITGTSITGTWLNLVEAILYNGYSAVTPADEGMGKELRNVTVRVPIKKPRTHEWYGGIAKHEGEALEAYIAQVVGEASHDRQNKLPFDYDYHQRLFHSGVEHPGEQGGYDQIKAIVDLIIPFKRSYMASTWQIPRDNEGDLIGYDQPCLVNLWCWLGWDTEIFKDEAEEIAEFYRRNRNTRYYEILEKVDEWLWATYSDNRRFQLILEMSVLFRNRDGGSAWLDNGCVITELALKIARMITNRIGVPVKAVRYCEHNFAIQIYPRDFPNIERAIKQKRR
jgi:hypothetical protein